MMVKCSMSGTQNPTSSISVVPQPRLATYRDIPAIIELVNGYAQEGIMLPLSMEQVNHQLSGYWVVGEVFAIVGCGALKNWGDGSMEVRALAVNRNCHGKRIGHALVNAVSQEAVKLGARILFALTLEPEFFLRQGFVMAQPDAFPRKVAMDCGSCLRKANCRELTVAKYF